MPLNMITQQVLKGQVDLTINPSIYTMQSTDVANIAAGDLVTVKASTAPAVPACGVVTSTTNSGFLTGVATLSPKQTEFKQSEMLEVALPGSVVYVQFSAAAIAANVRVSYSAKGVFKAAVTTEQAVGVTINSVASGGVGRIMIIKPELLP